MNKILFLHEIQNTQFWDDGLFVAIHLLSKAYDLDVKNVNDEYEVKDYNIIMSWGGMYSKPVDIAFHNHKNHKIIILLGGSTNLENFAQACEQFNIDAVCYETQWQKKLLISHGLNANKLHLAFGINDEHYNHKSGVEKIYDYLSIGSFSSWKRHELIINKPGVKAVVGEIQKNNIPESLSIVQKLLEHGVMVYDFLSPDICAKLINQSRNVFIPATIYGGGERAVLEARSCGVPVEVMGDNPKLSELTYGDIPNGYKYYHQLEDVLSKILS